jgi:hypothetical protein
MISCVFFGFLAILCGKMAKMAKNWSKGAQKWSEYMNKVHCFEVLGYPGPIGNGFDPSLTTFGPLWGVRDPPVAPFYGPVLGPACTGVVRTATQMVHHGSGPPSNYSAPPQTLVRTKNLPKNSPFGPRYGHFTVRRSRSPHVGRGDLQRPRVRQPPTKWSWAVHHRFGPPPSASEPPKTSFRSPQRPENSPSSPRNGYFRVRRSCRPRARTRG